MTEIEGPGYEDRRKFWVTLVDPFDIAGLLKGKDKEARFWETHQRIPAATTEADTVGDANKDGSGEGRSEVRGLSAA